MAKTYALALDVSPSEQVYGNMRDIKTMGIVLGLKSPASFQQVGSDFSTASKRLRLRKWSLSSNTYKRNFVSHIASVVETGNVICGYAHSNEANVLGTGGIFFQRYIGKFPEPSSINKKGKTRIQMGGYIQDGVLVPPFEVLTFDLCSLGWIASEALSLLHMIDQTNGESCKLDVIADRLPNEQGGDMYLLSTLLSTILSRASDKRISLIGVPDPSVTFQRDLFVDNVAGLAHHCEVCPESDLSEIVRQSPIRLFGITRDPSDYFLKKMILDQMIDGIR